MRTKGHSMIALALLALAASRDGAAAEGDPQAGAEVYRACVACHSLEPGRHRTGPSLAGVFGRRAGAAEGFMRYSEALKSANVTWTAETLDAWLADPAGYIPKNRMTFAGVKDERQRADLIAYLQQATAGGSPEQGAGMMGGMMSGEPQSLKEIDPKQQVVAIRYCGDTYFVTTAAGETLPYWEFNLRLKTDSSEGGPVPGRPAIMPGGMMGDRASVIFAGPGEISAFIEAKC